MIEPSLPPPPPPSDPIARSGNPWDRRDRLGWFSALLETVKVFVFSPGRAFAQTLERGDYAGPLIFAIVIGWVAVAVGQVWQILLGSTLLAWLPGDLSQQLEGMMVSTWIGLVAQLLLTPFYIAIALFIYSAILHLCLLLTGGLARSRAGFEGTFRVGAFASISNLANFVPLVGWLIAVVWSLVLAVIGFTSLHRATPGRATIAVLIPFLLCCACIAAAALLAGAAITGLFGQG